MTRSIVVIALALSIMVVLGHGQVVGLGAANIGVGAQVGEQKGLLAAQQSAAAREKAASSASQAAAAQQSAASAASASAHTDQAAWQQQEASAALKQSMNEIVDYCAGYICTEWLDEYGLEYVNQASASTAAQHSAMKANEGYAQNQFANQFANQYASQAANAAFFNKGIGAQGFNAYAAQGGALKAAGEQFGAGGGYGTGAGYGAGLGQVPLGSGWGSFSNLGALGQAAAASGFGAQSQYGVGDQSAYASQSQTGGYAQDAATSQAANAAANSGGSAVQYGSGAATQSAAATNQALNEAQLIRRKSYGRKCRSYQCYHQYLNGNVVSYGPNYVSVGGNLVNADQATSQHAAQQGSGYQTAQQASAADQAAAQNAAGTQYGSAVGAQQAGISGINSGYIPGGQFYY